ncbi:MAG: CD1247 N-terminal domain-containing protein [Acutalibacteraceae bacterium]
MMNLTEKISYIKGLCKGLQLDESKPEVKVINAIIDLLDDISYEVSELSEETEEISDTLDAMDEAIGDIFDECGLCDEDCCDCDDCDDCDDEDNPYYEVTCQHCDEKFSVSEDVLLYGEFPCPVCGEMNHYDFTDLFEEDGCACDCDECKGH